MSCPETHPLVIAQLCGLHKEYLATKEPVNET